MRNITLVESTPKTLQLSEEQASQLEVLSSELASDRSWWGESQDVQPRERAVIGISRVHLNTFIVTVRDAVGTVRLTDLQLIVIPKIPLDHFSYIASYSFGHGGRTADLETRLANGALFQDLVFQWFLSSLQPLIRGGLAKDYVSQSGGLTWVKGRMNPLATTLNLARGRVLAECEFEEHTTNVPANQVLATALRIGPLFSSTRNLGREFATTLMHFEDISSLSESGADTKVATLPHRYAKPLELARTILRGSGRALDSGGVVARSFLVRTPELIEAGVRAILKEKMEIYVGKRGRVLIPTHLRVTPDLELGPPPFTADVKYKVQGSTWNRSDLAQAVFFAEAFRSPKGGVISFSDSSLKLPDVPVGEKLISPFTWSIGVDVEPEKAANNLVLSIQQWVEGSDTH